MNMNDIFLYLIKIFVYFLAYNNLIVKNKNKYKFNYVLINTVVM